MMSRFPGTTAWYRTPFYPHLGAVVAVALAVRTAVAFGVGLPWQTPDTLDYLDMAARILEGAPRSYFPNGYPLFIAVVQAIVGEQALVSVLRLVNVLASAAVVGVAGLIGRRFLDERAGLLAALLVAFYPNQVNYARFVLTEPLTTLLLTVGVLWFLQPRPALSGAALALTSLFRTAYAPLFVLLPGIGLVFRQPRRRLVRFGLGLAFPALLYAGLAHGGVIAPSNNLSVNALFAVRSMSHRGIDWAAYERFTPDDHEHALGLYLAVAYEQPGTFVAQRLSSLWTLWGPLAPLGDGPQRRSLLSALLIGLRFPLLLLAIMGVWRRRKDAAAWIIAAPVVSVTLVHTAFFSQHRYTVPVEPLLVVLAMAGAWPWWVRVERSARRLPSRIFPPPEPDR